MGKSTIILADEQLMLCDLAAHLLRPEFDVVGMAHDGEALIVAAGGAPDVIVTDVHLPMVGGVELVRRVLAVSPTTRVVVLTMVDDPAVVAGAFEAGAAGYLLKTDAFDELGAAIRDVVAGRTYVTPSIERLLLRAGDRAGNASLTEREREVLDLLLDGKAMREAAEALNLTARTIAFHKYRIMKKLGVRSNAELIRAGLARTLTR